MDRDKDIHKVKSMNYFLNRTRTTKMTKDTCHSLHCRLPTWRTRSSRTAGTRRTERKVTCRRAKP